MTRGNALSNQRMNRLSAFNLQPATRNRPLSFTDDR
jgi:hypothetical protein